MGVHWLSGRVLDSRPRGLGFEPHRRLCVVSLSENINPGLVLVQPRKTRPFITERLLMGLKESNQAKIMQHTSLFCPKISSGTEIYPNLETVTCDPMFCTVKCLIGDSMKT